MGQAARATPLVSLEAPLEGLSRPAAQRWLDQRPWTEREYFSLENQRRLELTEGQIEVLPVATEEHQDINAFAYERLGQFTQAYAPGKVQFTGIRIRIAPGKYRQPDLAYMKQAHARRRHNDYWDGADLLMEVVSGDAKDRRRDLRDKTQEYANARVPEYWIIDPKRRRIIVYALVGPKYRLHGEFGPGEQATSVLLPGFNLDVDEVFAAGENS